MKKKTWILALVLIVLAAIPATAGPAMRTPAIIETPLGLDMPSLSAVPTTKGVSLAGNVAVLPFSRPDHFVFVAAPMLLSTAMINQPVFGIAIMATLAVLTSGMGTSNNIFGYHRVQKANDRMHGLARDQCCLT
ncbi:MAG TPA: hypothetical protein VN445_09085 [Rectinemataceae bacterium]|nr:hypothetical protein [Rectinemataceae bacterium]